MSELGLDEEDNGLKHGSDSAHRVFLIDWITLICNRQVGESSPGWRER